MEIYHEIFSVVILFLPSVVSYKRKYVHRVLVNHLVKLAQEKSVRLTDNLDMTIAVDGDKHDPVLHAF